jgi:hypothetical protein
MKALPRIMLVTSALHATPTGGRELLCKLNHDTLQVLYGDRLRLVELPRARPRGLRQMANAFRGHIDGIDHASLSAALARIESEAVDQVFLDGSNLGEFARAVKAGWPQVEVVTFLHNVEARFFAGAFRQAKSIRALAVLLANYLAERKAVRHSDKLVTLSQRDSLQLQALYGRAATHVVPMALQDQLPAKAGPFPAARTSPEPPRAHAPATPPGAMPCSWAACSMPTRRVLRGSWSRWCRASTSGYASWGAASRVCGRCWSATARWR